MGGPRIGGPPPGALDIARAPALFAHFVMNLRSHSALASTLVLSVVVVVVAPFGTRGF